MYKTALSKPARGRIATYLENKKDFFKKYIAEPLALTYKLQEFNTLSPNASLIFTFDLLGAPVILNWTDDSVVINCKNQNRVIKDSLISAQWVEISVNTLISAY